MTSQTPVFSLFPPPHSWLFFCFFFLFESTDDVFELFLSVHIRGPDVYVLV